MENKNNKKTYRVFVSFEVEAVSKESAENQVQYRLDEISDFDQVEITEAVEK